MRKMKRQRKVKAKVEKVSVHRVRKKLLKN